MVCRKVQAAKKIFQLGFDYSWALIGKNNQRSHCEAIQIKKGELSCLERTHIVKILASALYACVYFNDSVAAFGSLLKNIVVSQFKPVAERNAPAFIRFVNIMRSSSRVNHHDCLSKGSQFIDLSRKADGLHFSQKPQTKWKSELEMHTSWILDLFKPINPQKEQKVVQQFQKSKVSSIQ